MDFRQLGYFTTLTECMNFTKAAKKLYIAQSTLSQQIQGLEAEIGVKLLERDSHGVRLTPAGELFLREAKILIQKRQEAVQAVRLLGEDVSGEVKIGFLAGYERDYLPELAERLSLRHKNIKLSIKNLEMRALDQSLSKGGIDFAFTVLPHGQTIGGVCKQVLYTEKICLVLPAFSPLHSAGKQDFSSVDIPFVFSDSKSRAMVHMVQICTERGVQPDFIFAPTLEEMLLLIGSGSSVSLLPTTICEAYCGKNVKYFEIPEKDALIDVLAVWKEGVQNPLADLVRSELDAIIKSSITHTE